ncbi:hypothetical protein D3C86_1288560 [compost metagenome]
MIRFKFYILSIFIAMAVSTSAYAGSGAFVDNRVVIGDYNTSGSIVDFQVPSIGSSYLGANQSQRYALTVWTDNQGFVQIGEHEFKN